MTTVDDIINAPDPLASRVDEIIASPEPSTSLSNPLAPGSGTLMHVMAGANKWLARTLDLPTDVVQYAAEKAGLPAGPERVAPGTRLFKALGIKTEPAVGEADSHAYKIGESIAQDVALSLATSGAAAVGAAATRSGTFLNNVFQQLAQHPALMALMSAGAAPGGEAGEFLTSGSDSGAITGAAVGGAAAAKATPGPLLVKGAAALAGAIGGGYGGSYLPAGVDTTMGHFAGALAGGLTVGAAARGTQAGVEAVGKKIGDAYDKITGTSRPIVRPTALMDNAIDPEQARIFAQTQYEGDLGRINKMIDDVVERIPQSARTNRRGVTIPETSGQVQQRVTQELERVEKVAGDIEDRFWSQVPKKTLVPEYMIMPDIQTAVTKMAQEYPSTDIPHDVLAEIAKRYEQVGPNSFRVGTVEQLINIRAMARQERRTEQAQVAPNDRKIANLNKIEQILQESIAKALPDDMAIQRARGVSRTIYEIFGQGPVADVMRLTRRGDPSTPPDKIVEALLNRTGGVSAMQDIVKELRGIKPIPGRPGAPRPYAYPQEATPAEMAKIADLESGYTEALQTMFREAANQRGLVGESANKWLTDQRMAEIKPVARLSAEFQYTKQQVNALLDYREAVEKSALAKFAGMDSRKAVLAVYGAKDPAAFARSVMNDIGHDADAMNAFRQGVAEQLFQFGRLSADRNVIDPVAVMKWYVRPDVNRMLHEVMPPDWLNRLDRMLSVATGIQKGDINPASRSALMASMPLARFAGAQLGTFIAHAFGHGNIQVPGMFAQWGKSMVQQAMAEQDPVRLLAKAISDPSWEKFLLSKEPSTTAQWKDTNRLLRRVVATEETARAVADGMWERNRNNSEPLPTAWQFATKQPGERVTSYGVDLKKKPTFTPEGMSDMDMLMTNPAVASDFSAIQAVGSAANRSPEAAERFRRAVEGWSGGANIEDRRLGTIPLYKQLLGGLYQAGEREGVTLTHDRDQGALAAKPIKIRR